MLEIRGPRGLPAPQNQNAPRQHDDRRETGDQLNPSNPSRVARGVPAFIGHGDIPGELGRESAPKFFAEKRPLSNSTRALPSSLCNCYRPTCKNRHKKGLS